MRPTKSSLALFATLLLGCSEADTKGFANGANQDVAIARYWL